MGNLWECDVYKIKQGFRGKIMCNKIIKIVLVLGMLLFVLQVQVDQLVDIKVVGVVKVVIFDVNLLFGFVDVKIYYIVGYDVDFVQVLVKVFGVKFELVVINLVNCILLLQFGKVDLIVVDIIIILEWVQVIDFLMLYFVIGQQFFVLVGFLDKFDEYSKVCIGVVKGIIGEQVLYQCFLQVCVFFYDDILLVLIVLCNGNVQVIIQDSIIFVGLLVEVLDKVKFKILFDLFSKEEIGVGVKKGELVLLKVVNDELVKLEKIGEVVKIYDVWFGFVIKMLQLCVFIIEVK